MTISYGALAGLIAAIAFLILVLFTIPMLIRTAKVLKETSATIQTTNIPIQSLIAVSSNYPSPPYLSVSLADLAATIN